MGDGSGYNPYRKGNGEFASKDEVGDLNEKLASDLVDAQDAGDEKLAAQIENYAMDKLPESPIGKKLLEEKYGAAATAQKDSGDYSSIGLRDLQKAAKDTQNPDLQNEIAKRGNAAALKNLARNPKATTEALEAAYIRTDDDSVRQEIAANLNSDTRIMHPFHVAYAASENYRLGREAKDRNERARYRERAEKIAAADSIDDATVGELKRLHDEEKKRFGFSNLRSDGPLVDAAMANPNNLISEDAAIDYANTSPRAATIALESGRISGGRLRELSADSAHFENITNPKILARAAEISASGQWDSAERDPWGKEDPVGRESRRIADGIIANPHTTSAALDQLVGSAQADPEKLYTHPKISERSKIKLEAKSEAVRSRKRIQQAQSGRSLAELKAELKISGGSTSTQTGYHSTSIQLDKAKIEAYGLSKEDVERLMGGEKHFYSYNPDTGRYSGSMDSSG